MIFFFLSDTVSNWINRPTFQYGMLTGAFIGIVAFLVGYVVVRYDSHDVFEYFSYIPFSFL